MGKKIIGFILLIPAIFFTLAVIVSTPRTLTKVFAVFNSGFESYTVGYAMGSLFGYAFLIFVAYYLWKRVLKLTRGETLKPESIDDIGKE